MKGPRFKPRPPQKKIMWEKVGVFIEGKVGRKKIKVVL